MILITCACLGSQASMRAKEVWSCVTLFIAYSFSCSSFHCILCKNSQFVIKRISHSNPTYGNHFTHYTQACCVITAKLLKTTIHHTNIMWSTAISFCQYIQYQLYFAGFMFSNLYIAIHVTTALWVYFKISLKRGQTYSSKL